MAASRNLRALLAPIGIGLTGLVAAPLIGMGLYRITEPAPPSAVAMHVRCAGDAACKAVVLGLLGPVAGQDWSGARRLHDALADSAPDTLSANLDGCRNAPEATATRACTETMDKLAPGEAGTLAAILDAHDQWKSREELEKREKCGSDGCVSRALAAIGIYGAEPSALHGALTRSPLALTSRVLKDCKAASEPQDIARACAPKTLFTAPPGELAVALEADEVANHPLFPTPAPSPLTPLRIAILALVSGLLLGALAMAATRLISGGRGRTRLTNPAQADAAESTEADDMLVLQTAESAEARQQALRNRLKAEMDAAPANPEDQLKVLQALLKEYTALVEGRAAAPAIASAPAPVGDIQTIKDVIVPATPAPAAASAAPAHPAIVQPGAARRETPKPASDPRLQMRRRLAQQKAIEEFHTAMGLTGDAAVFSASVEAEAGPLAQTDGREGRMAAAAIALGHRQKGDRPVTEYAAVYDRLVQSVAGDDYELVWPARGKPATRDMETSDEGARYSHTVAAVLRPGLRSRAADSSWLVRPRVLLD